METVRVRFAPSPTGFLHIGGARTALFNWLFARAMNGKFLLRIEDTDRQRSEDRFTDDIMESLKWLGLDWDEPPIFQFDRFQRYAETAEKLITEGKAYRCDCTEEALNAVRAQCEKQKRAFRYPGTCRDKKDVSGKSVVRVKVPKSGETGFTDLIRGLITIQNKDIDDWVILRSDGSPTYNFCVVIDDSDQNISHVMRGDDHINNTPKQILMYQSLELKVPHFAHLPMILGTDRAKLSKRHGAASTLEYRKMGYLPEAIINFLVRLGWSHGDQEFFTPEELRKYFSLDKIGKANAVFNPEKLTWISGHVMADALPSRLLSYVTQYFSGEITFLKSHEADVVEKGIKLIQGKVKTVPELIEQLKCLFDQDPSYELDKVSPEEKANLKTILAMARPAVENSDFTHDDLSSKIRTVAETLKLKLTPVAQALRLAVTGGRVSPGLFEMLEIQGKTTVVRRIDNALKALG